MPGGFTNCVHIHLNTLQHASSCIGDCPCNVLRGLAQGANVARLQVLTSLMLTPSSSTLG